MLSLLYRNTEHGPLLQVKVRTEVDNLACFTNLQSIQTAMKGGE